MTSHYDVVIVGSGFGGSVSALRLSEKGYRVLVVEKGLRFRKEDFPKTNWNLRKWMWLPQAGLFGIFKMSFFEHLTVLSGVGVGGGSLVYANTLPVPKAAFFEGGSWKGMAPWAAELSAHYATAKRMLGANPNPHVTEADRIIREMAEEDGRADHFGPTDVAIFFGEPGKEVPDPYFDGAGPPRSGCTFCGACMTGCRHGAKNTLDKNYLYLAEGHGAEILPETRVTAVRPRAEGGYRIEALEKLLPPRKKRVFTADKVVLSGGVLGTVELLLAMKADPHGLPNLSPRTGELIRTNSESLIGVVTRRRDVDLSQGVAISAIYHTDEHSHLEPVRYGAGSGFFRLLMAAHAPANTLAKRAALTLKGMLADPKGTWSTWTVPDMATYSQVLLFMRTLDGTLALELGRGVRTGFGRGLRTRLSKGSPPPLAFMEEATTLAKRFAEKLDGVLVNLMTEAISGVPSTAHILGGACIGPSPEEGVIDQNQEVYAYPGLYVVDGSAVSANPGVNPSLTIAAMAERAMHRIPPRVP